MAVPDLSRQQVLAYRAAVQGLSPGTAARRVGSLDVLGIGLQDTPAGSARTGLRARVVDDHLPAEHPDLAFVLGVRGAPHLHRRSDLPGLRRALCPTDTEELLDWLGGPGEALAASGLDGPELVRQVTDLMRELFPGDGCTKGELSALVSPRVPEPARPWCARCGSYHVVDGLFRLGAFLAGLEVLPDGGRRLRFRRPAAASEPARDIGRADLARMFLRQVGPVTEEHLGRWVTTRPVGRSVWAARAWRQLSDDLVEVHVDGRPLWALAEIVDRLRTAPPTTGLRLLPPRDPYLHGERRLLVGEPAWARQVWRSVGSPGVLLQDGEVVGTWRQRVVGRRLELEAQPFRPGATLRQAELEEQATALAADRGATETRVRVPAS